MSPVYSSHATDQTNSCRIPLRDPVRTGKGAHPLTGRDLAVDRSNELDWSVYWVSIKMRNHSETLAVLNEAQQNSKTFL